MMKCRTSRVVVASAALGLLGVPASAVLGQPGQLQPVDEPAGVVVAAPGHDGVSVDLGALDRDGVSFLLPSGDRVTGVVSGRVTHANGTRTWQGSIEGQEHAWFSVAASDGVAHGVVWAGELGTFELRYRGDGSGLYDTVRVDTTDFPPCAGPMLPDAAARGIPGLRERAQAGDGHTARRSARGGDDGSVVDVMIVYTAQARAGWGGQAAIEALCQNSVDVTNTAYANSGVAPLELRLVHTYEVSYAESGSASDDLFALTDTDDGLMDEVHQLRDQYGADLVAMLVDDFNACGVAFLAPFNQAFGFSVTDTGCAVGNLSFPHEIGHNMGAAHDRDNAGSSVYSYGYGWRWNGSSGTQFRSVMAYSPGSRVPHFSSPAVAFDSIATGTASDDNARVHQQTRSSVAAFRQSVVAPACLADTNGDGALSPADFNAWVIAFNSQSAACDQNGDSACTAADFNAWIGNYNAGC